MAKRKIMRRSNRPFTYNPHYYSWGGDFKAAMGDTGAFDLKSTFSGGNVAGMLKGGLAGGLGSAVGNIAGGAIGGGFKSGAGSAISNVGGALGGIVGTVNPLLGGIVSAGTGIIGGLTNRMFGSKLNKEKIAEVEGSNKAINTVMVDSSSADSVMNQWANQDFGADFSKSDIGKDGWFSNKAKNKYKELKRQQDIARNRALASYENAADAADTQSDLNAMANFAAFGGPLGIWGGYGSGAIDYELAKENLGIKALNAANKGKLTSLPNSFSSELNTFADGGKIYIKPENRGKFTALKERTGKSATWFKEHGTPAQKKMATFALNSRKWKHDDGGPLSPYSAESLVNAIYDSSVGEEFLGKPSHNYDFTQSDEWANSHGYYPDSRGHRDDRVKKPAHPTHPSRGNWTGNVFNLTDKGMRDPNYILFGMNDGGQDPQDIMSYKGGIVLPEITVTPRNSYINNSYDNTHIIMKRKKAFGGDLLTHGAEWDNGLRVIGNGGTHEENPMEGVPMGMDAEGNPNLVEQGEVIFNDYVFSNRLFADSSLLESFNLPKSYDGYSFAAIAEKLGDESKERPNDPISKRGLLSSMSKLQQAQEMIRQSKNTGNKKSFGGGLKSLATSLFGSAFDNYRLAKGNLEFGMFGAPNPYAHGGKMGTLFDGTGDKPNIMARAKAKRLGYDVGNSLKDYFEDPVYENEDTNKGFDLTQLRYAPVIGAAIGLGQNLFSRPDYTSADAILEAANQAGNYTPIDYTPIGNYLQYRPFDRNFYLNKLNAQAGATRRAIMNTTSPSRNAALLAADYNAQGRLGDLARQAEEYNLAQRQAVETFNRSTNQANAEMGLKAAMANQEAALKARSSRLSGVAQAMAVRDAVDARRGASMSANLTNLFDSLGNIGIDAYNREDRDKLIRAGVFGTLSEKPQEWSDETWKEYKDYINKSLENKTPKIKGKQHSKGGYLTIKKGKQHGKF